MICKRPIFIAKGKEGFPVGCGQCLPCRINQKRVWTWRMYLESLCHDANSFVTLTYSPENYPEDGSLRPDDVQRWLKRLRKSISPRKVRYYLVGEYGDETQRAHYHACLFGLGPLDTAVIDASWGLGHTMVAEFNDKTAQYVCGYVTKKMTSTDDPRLNGRHPEFARMSTRPGLGAEAMKVVADGMHTDGALDEYLKTGDVPASLRFGRRSMPLGRYLREKLREEFGVPKYERAKIRGRSKMEALARMQVVRDDQEKDKRLTVKEGYQKANVQKIRNVESKSRVWKKRNTL